MFGWKDKYLFKRVCVGCVSMNSIQGTQGKGIEEHSSNVIVCEQLCHTRQALLKLSSSTDERGWRSRPKPTQLPNPPFITFLSSVYLKLDEIIEPKLDHRGPWYTEAYVSFPSQIWR